MLCKNANYAKEADFDFVLQLKLALAVFVNNSVACVAYATTTTRKTHAC